MQRRSLAGSFRDAFAGIAYVFRTQRSARIQVATAVAVTVLALALRLPSWDMALLAMAIAAVLAAEMANTVLETLVDMVSPGPSEGARIAKDASAGAVLILAIGAAVVGFCVFWRPLWQAVLGRQES